ncbi:dynactin arp1 p25 subunit like protein [Teratosphaeria destructans]|uniref:Dynactin subunit 5 n=1 Tax=Teratosphaeria destructans TaxID=418781 RepID=A0A9W7SL28_9PEZI|nr:dynactin arp1 p25 subunit like protein [Teratosphaeria destructans]
MSRSGPVNRRSTKTEYIETDTGNKISRRSHIEGKQNIMLGGRSVVMAGVTLRGDLFRRPDRPAEGEKEGPSTAITVGRASIISTNCTIRPPMRLSRGQMTFYPMRISDNVFIGAGTHVSSLSISSHVHIGANCVLMPFCVIKEQCKILPNTVVPPHMIIPPGSLVAGRPARIIGEVPEGWGQGGGGDEEFVKGGDLRPLVKSIR